MKPNPPDLSSNKAPPPQTLGGISKNAIILLGVAAMIAIVFAVVAFFSR